MSDQINGIINTPVGGFGAGILGVIGVWVANRVLGKAAFQTAINSGFDNLLKQQQQINNELRVELHDVREQHADCQRQQAELRMSIDKLMSEKVAFYQLGPK